MNGHVRTARDVIADRLEQWFGTDAAVYNYADLLLHDLDSSQFEIVRVDEWGDIIRSTTQPTRTVRYVALADDPSQHVCAGDLFETPSMAPTNVRLGIVVADIET